MSQLDDQRKQAVAYFRDLQDRICTGLAAVDGGPLAPRAESGSRSEPTTMASFREDSWNRPGGGGGRTRVIIDGGVFEKAGVNFSEVYGQMSPEFAKQLPGEGLDFTAAGMSLVLHPRSPMVPTVHANFRFLTKGDKQWFGGGSDLTPYYPFREDVIAFHRAWRDVCRSHAAVVDYQRLK